MLVRAMRSARAVSAVEEVSPGAPVELFSSERGHFVVPFGCHQGSWVGESCRVSAAQPSGTLLRLARAPAGIGHVCAQLELIASCFSKSRARSGDLASI